MEDRMSVLHALVIAMMVVSISIPVQAQQSKPSARKPASGQPKPTQQLFYDGFEAYKADRFKDAIGLFEKGLRQDPANALAAFYLGEAYGKTGNQAKAQEWYAASLEANPQSEVAAQARERLAAAQRGAAAPTPSPANEGPLVLVCKDEGKDNEYHILIDSNAELMEVHGESHSLKVTPDAYRGEKAFRDSPDSPLLAISVYTVNRYTGKKHWVFLVPRHDPQTSDGMCEKKPRAQTVPKY
jgi:tetratricopeptide (TPR) repeat protein